MNRENRYIVIKRSDVNEGNINALACLPQREAVVVEADWPEFEPVWAMIEARVSGTNPPAYGPRILTCVYCGHEYPQDTPASGSAVLTNHIEVCTKHPMKRVIDDRDRMRRALEGLIGTSDIAELKQFELAIRQEAAPAADKAAAVDAVHALLAYYQAQGAETHCED